MGMNRRSFFKKAVTGAAVLAVAPKILSELSEPFMPIIKTPVPVPELIDPYDTIGQWVSYKYHFTVLPAPVRGQKLRFAP